MATSSAVHRSAAAGQLKIDNSRHRRPSEDRRISLQGTKSFETGATENPALPKAWRASRGLREGKRFHVLLDGLADVQPRLFKGFAIAEAPRESRAVGVVTLILMFLFNDHLEGIESHLSPPFTVLTACARQPQRTLLGILAPMASNFKRQDVDVHPSF